MSKQEKITPEIFMNKYVIIRTYSAGVHLGTLAYYDAATKDVILTDARRLWYWEGAFTLSQVANEGIDFSSSKLSVAVPFIKLTEVEITLVNEDVATKFKEAPSHDFRS